jgi:hypothetical protein
VFLAENSCPGFPDNSETGPSIAGGAALGRFMKAGDAAMAQATAEALIRDRGARAYSAARQRERA